MKNSNNKKNILRVLLAALMLVTVFSFAACSNETTDPNPEPPKDEYDPGGDITTNPEDAMYYINFEDATEHGGKVYPIDSENKIYEFSIEKGRRFDYLEVSIETTENIIYDTSESGLPEILYYPEKRYEVYPIKIDLLDTADVVEGFEPDYRNIEYESITIMLTTYKDDEVVYSVNHPGYNPSVTIFAFATPTKMYVGGKASAAPYYLYLKDLYDSGAITEDEYNEAYDLLMEDWPFYPETNTNENESSETDTQLEIEGMEEIEVGGGESSEIQASEPVHTTNFFRPDNIG